jgi:hypothetical protein
MDFVDFNLANRLKELGFNEPFSFFYREDDKDKCVHHAIIHKPLIYCDEIDNEVIIAPTISQVLNWLREEHHLHFEVVGAAYGYNLIISDTPDKGGTDRYYSHANDDGPNYAGAWDKYEDCVLYGIEYVLNLI